MGDMGPVTGSIFDPRLPVKCRECGHARTILDALQAEAYCPGCFEQICGYCGCTEATACADPGIPRYTCEWQEPGLCSFCFQKFAEFMYHMTNGDREKLQKFKAEVPAVFAVAEGTFSHE